MSDPANEHDACHGMVHGHIALRVLQIMHIQVHELTTDQEIER